MSGYEEAAALIAEYAAEEEAAAAAAAALAAGGTAAGAATTGGLTAAELAAMSSVGGGAEVGGLLGASEAAAPATFGSIYGAGAYGAGDTVTNSLLANSAYPAALEEGPGAAAAQGSGLGANSFATPYDELKYKAIGALNKAGGAYNKLPGPVQGMLAGQTLSAMMPKQGQPPPQMGMRPQPQGPAQPSTPTYNQQPYQAQSFGSQYGKTNSILGGQQITPELLALLKKLQGAGYA